MGTRPARFWSGVREGPPQIQTAVCEPLQEGMLAVALQGGSLEPPAGLDPEGFVNLLSASLFPPTLARETRIPAVGDVTLVSLEFSNHAAPQCLG